MHCFASPSASRSPTPARASATTSAPISHAPTTPSRRWASPPRGGTPRSASSSTASPPEPPPVNRWWLGGPGATQPPNKRLLVRLGGGAEVGLDDGEALGELLL